MVYRNTSRRRIASLLCATALVTLVTAAPAFADCTTSGPSPAAPGLSSTGSGPSLVAQSSSGDTGCNGGSASIFGSGHAGSDGQDAGPNEATITSGTITSTNEPAVSLANTGGAGGDGSGDSDAGVNTHAGNGGRGAYGGDLTVNVGVGTTLLASGTVISAQTIGGDGGQGATGYNNASGGNAGNGGQVAGFSLAASSSVTSTGPGAAVVILSQGGAGGYQKGNTRSADNIGNLAGDGGSASSIVVSLNGFINATLGDGASIQGLGGDGGHSGDVIAVFGKASGTTGGNGGNGAATVNVAVTGTVQASGTALLIASNGGSGGAGAYAGAGAVANGGTGGVGGSGGSVTATTSALVSGTIGIYTSADGGAGGGGGTGKGSATTEGGVGGNGGAGGTQTLTLAGTVFGSTAAALATANGGTGGNGGASSGATLASGGRGGTGGVGGTTDVTISGSISSAGIGVLAAANGGDGGGGARASASYAGSGNGGDGGSSRSSTLTLLAGASVTTVGPDAADATAVLPGIYVQANGGIAGAGGSTSGIIGPAGGGGLGGDGGTATANLYGDVSTTGSYAHAVLVQSVSGAGGKANDSDAVYGSIGNGAGAGGNGGSVNLTTFSGLFQTAGTGASAIVAQSIGGGGGAGGDASSGAAGAAAFGSDGGAGGNGMATTLMLANISVTHGDNAAAVIAQSIGGSGGVGGNAVADGGEAAVAFGGDGNYGGNGGLVQVTNGGLINTFGSHSGGVAAQSVGGGGGDGGSAVATTIGASLAVAFSLGGKGGNAGTGGQVDLINNSQVITFGADSYGLKSQTVAGGGGEGGSSSASASASSGGADVRSIALAISIGGQGGAGGSGALSPVTIVNNGFVATAGDGAMGLLAQNIAGGGGNGGDSSASAFSTGTTSAYQTSVSVGGGGDGGNGGSGGVATIHNNALVLTLGESAYGMLVQSVGGGGGQGSGGDSAASNDSGQLPGDSSLKGALTIGGNGGTGGVGGNVLADNAGGIATAGDGARAIMAQSIGGGGGVAGGGVAKANGTGVLTLTIVVGGNGGTGGVGGTVDVANHYGLATSGANADGIFAQSVGGGGGVAGKVASTSGGAQADSDLSNQLKSAITNGLGIGQAIALVSGTTDVYQVGDGKLSTVNSVSELEAILAATRPVAALACCANDGLTTGRLTLNVTVGGNGGTGGDGNVVNVYNEGAIATSGLSSNGIFAQSVGGGGGVGGAVSFTDAYAGSTNIGVGGTGGTSGNGSTVTITNAAEAQVSTTGLNSFALLAQSVGGGGGLGGATGSTIAWANGPTLNMGGAEGSGGVGGAVTISNDVSAYVETTGKNAIGILAQSVGGGGGIVLAQTKDQARGTSDDGSADPFDISFAFGGSDVGINTGDGGAVTVISPTVSTQFQRGVITTTGRGAYGILAQSIGGGGGLEIGGNITGNSFFTSGTMRGNGGTVTVEVGNALSTIGVGAVGVFAQSVGGGGGIAGDTGSTAQRQAFVSNGIHGGTGGGVNVTIDPTGSVTTSGANAPAILAQSIGGGGGRVSQSNAAYAYDGTLGGTGAGGAVTVTVNGTVSATGPASSAIFAESVGQTASPITVTVNDGATVSGGRDFNPGDGFGAGVYLVGGNDANVVTVNGTLTSVAGVSGTAIYTVGGNKLAINVGSMGTITGKIGGQANLTINNQGTINAGSSIDLGTGTLRNDGHLVVGGSAAIGTTALIGNLVQGSGGTLVIDADFASGKADLIAVTGRADIAGSVQVKPTSISNKTLTVLTATQGVTLEPSLFSTTATQLYAFTPMVSGNTLQIQTKANFTAVAAALGNNQRAVAANLQSVFDGGGNMDRGFTALGSVNSPTAYAQSLSSLSGQSLGALAAVRYNSSHSFVANMYGGCASMDPSATGECAWTRVVRTWTRQDSTSDELGYQASTTAFQLGGQREIADHWHLSGSAAYEGSHINAGDHSAKISGNSLIVGGYLRYDNGPLQVSTAADASYGWYRSKRFVLAGNISGTALARPEEWDVGLHGRIAYTVTIGAAGYAKPFFDAHAVYVRGSAYTEHGLDAFNLAIEAQGNTALAGAAGIEIGARIKVTGGAVLRPFASAAYAVLNNNDWSTIARFADQPASSQTFRASTPAPAHLGKFVLGVDLFASAKADLSFSYTPEVGSGYVSHAGVARLSYRF